MSWLRAAKGTERLPDLGWNVPDIAHMTDNTRIWSERLIAVARGADRKVVPYDPDLLAEARRYNEVALEGANGRFGSQWRFGSLCAERASLKSLCCTRSGD